MKALLISNSFVHKGGYLDHCADEMIQTLDGIKRILFIPYALQDWSKYAEVVIKRFQPLGITVESLGASSFPQASLTKAEAVFVGGGNTFLLLHTLYRFGLVELLRSRVVDGVPYFGTSAGANIACPTITTTNDMPIIWPRTLRALGLVPFGINPHYIDPDASSTHMGETRESRIREFHQLHSIPIVGLREGTWLNVTDNSISLRGSAGARLFRRGLEPTEIPPNRACDYLLTDHCQEAT